MVRSDSLSSTIRMSATEGPGGQFGPARDRATSPAGVLEALVGGVERLPRLGELGLGLPQPLPHLRLLVRAVAAGGAVDEGARSWG